MKKDMDMPRARRDMTLGGARVGGVSPPQTNFMDIVSGTMASWSLVYWVLWDYTPGPRKCNVRSESARYRCRDMCVWLRV